MMLNFSSFALSVNWLETLKLYLSYPFVRYAIIAGVLILREPFSLPQMAGAALIICGVYVANMKKAVLDGV